MSTHPEYWSETMYDHLNAFLAAGGRLLNLGGNAIFEVTTYIDPAGGDEPTALQFLGGIEHGERAPVVQRMLQNLLGMD